MEAINEALDRLIDHWKKLRIGSYGKTIQEVKEAEKRLDTKLPNDFVLYFGMVNGMGNNYLNDTDEGGFSFYQLEDLIAFDTDLKGGIFSVNNYKFILFADYLQKCWSYLVAIDSDDPMDKYFILVYVDPERYKVIANSLREFIDLYLADSPDLYDINEISLE